MAENSQLNTENLISIEDEVPANNGAISIEGGDKAVLPETTVKERAEKANFGLGDASPGVDSLRNTIGRGDENYARQAAATAIDLKNRQLRYQIIENIAKSRPNQGVSPEEIDLVKGLTNEQLENPNTIFESQYAKRLYNDMALAKKNDDALFNKQMAANPNDTFDTMDFAQSVLTRQEVAKTKLQDLQSRWNEMGNANAPFGIGLGQVADFAKTLIPFHSWANISNEVPGFKGAGFDLPGQNLRDQVQYLWSLPPKEFEEKLSKTLEGISQSSITDAMTFASAVMSFSTSDEVLQNSFGIADLFDAGTAAVAVGKGLRAAVGGVSKEARIKKAVTDALKASEDVATKPEKIVEVAGDTERASTLKAIQNTLAEKSPEVPATTADKFRGMLNTVPSILNPTRPTADIGNLTREAASRLGLKLQTSAERLTEGILDPVQAQRLTPEALAKAVENAKNELREEFFHVSDSVLDVVQNPRNTLTNTDSVSIRLGDPQAQPFESVERAEVWAKDLYNLPEGSYNIKQEGTNFYIDVPKAIDETKDSVRNLLINTDNKTPQSNAFATKLLNWIRSPAETLSNMSKANRNVVSLAQENSLKFVKEVAKEIGTVPKKYREDFESILRRNRDWVDPATSERGRFYSTVGELQENYLQHLGRLPTEQEVSAYFHYVQLSDYDWVLRNTTMLRDKERLGLKRFRFEYRGEFEDGNPFFTKTDYFEGKEVDHIPWGSNHLSAVLYDPTTRATQIIQRTSPRETQLEIDSMIRAGKYRIVQVADPVARPFKDVIGSNEPIQYVITKAFDKTELALKQIGYQPGGHVLYRDKYWVKQPKLYNSIGGQFYEGDVTAFNFSTRAQADKFAKRMEEGRRLLNAGDDAALEAFLEKNLPYSKNQFKELFAENGHFDPKNPFFASESGQKYTDLVKLDSAKIKDISGGAYNLNDSLDRTFTGHRDMNGLTIRESGTEANPVLNLAQAELIDPTSTLARGIGQATRSRFFGDMKTHAAESFVQEFKDVLARPIDELRNSPIASLMKPEWNEKADPVRLAQAKTVQRNALNFIGQQTPLGSNLEWLKSRLADNVYGLTGQKAADWLSSTAMMQSRDPLSFFRAAAFHAKLGLFNPVQMFVQAQGMAHMVALAPREATAAMTGYTLMRRLMMNDSPEIVAGAADRAAKLGWKRDDFLEAFDAFRRSGWGNVGREQALLDDMSDPTLYQGTIGKFLNKGMVFYNEGERLNRIGAWNAAYLQWKKANPYVKVGDKEIGEIMTRADTLSLNMTRASKSVAETGILSIPAQFMSYQLRLMDQFAGKQLTWAEKARAFGMYSTLYGVPVGASAVTGYPWYDDVKTWAIENGYESNGIVKLMMEGLPATMISLITGNDYNVAQRLGPNGLNFIQDIKNGDKSALEIVTGASGGIVKDIYKSVAPLAMGLGIVFEDKSSYEPLVQDLLDATRSISSVNNTLRMAMALNTGKYITKNDVYLSDMTTMDAVISYITGLTPSKISDAMLMSRSLKETNDLQKEAEKNFQKYYRRALNEGANGNDKAMEAYFKRARAYLILGDFRPDQYSDLLGRALSNQGSVVERMGQRWFKQAPGSQVEKRFKQTLDNVTQTENLRNTQ